jgi:hypothetical protein
MAALVEVHRIAAQPVKELLGRVIKVAALKVLTVFMVVAAVVLAPPANGQIPVEVMLGQAVLVLLQFWTTEQRLMLAAVGAETILEAMGLLAVSVAAAKALALQLLELLARQTLAVAVVAVVAHMAHTTADQARF